jgi:hypothetical protein
MTITGASLVQRATDVAWVRSSDRVAAVRLWDVTSEPVVLTGPAVAIWESLEAEMTVDALVSLMAEHHGLDEDEVRPSIHVFLSECLLSGLITEVG